MGNKVQNLASKRGEVAYRSRLVLQYQGKRVFFPNEPDKKEIIGVLEQRLQSTKKDLAWLKKQYNINFSPYLEIGAEFGQRAAILEEKYGAQGFALDISLESLSLAPFIVKHLKLKRVPERICADAYHLPFLNNSFNFIYCYQTLHHFPDPAPVIREIYRVLKPGGYFFVNEEPVSQIFNLKLWRRPTKLRAWERFLKYALILPFVSTIGKTETEHGILEEAFDLATWQRGLDVFEGVTVWLKPYPFGPKSIIHKKPKTIWLKPSITTRPFITFFGAGIKVLGKKTKEHLNNNLTNVEDFINCPSCLEPLNQNLACPRCHVKYFSIKNIKILLPKTILNKLYAGFKNDNQ